MTTIFRKAQIKREKLKEIILKNPGYLQPDLSFIDLQIGSRENDGLIDFLGVDENGRLMIVDFDSLENDGLLITALSHLQWLKNNEVLIKRLFFSENIDFDKTPSLMLIAPSFSAKFRAAAGLIEFMPLKLISFNYIRAEENDAIFFEEIFSNSSNQKKMEEDAVEYLAVPPAEQPPRHEEPALIYPQDRQSQEDYMPSQPRPSQPGPEKKGPSLEEIALSAEEIAEFMDFDKEFEKESA